MKPSEEERQLYCRMCLQSMREWLEAIKRGNAFTWRARYPKSFGPFEWPCDELAKRDGHYGEWTSLEAINLRRNGYSISIYGRPIAEWFTNDLSDDNKVRWNAIRWRDSQRWEREQENSPDWVGSESSGYGMNAFE